MRIFVDLVTLLPTAEIWDRATVVANASAKRGDGSPLEVQFHRSGVPERLPLGTVISFVGKSEGKFDQDPAPVLFELTDAHRPDADAGFYVGYPDYNTAPLDAVLNSGDANDGNDVRVARLDAEISWLEATLGAKPKSTQTFLLQVQNDVLKGNEGPPGAGGPTYLTAAQSDARYAQRGITAPDLRLDITGLTGGGATNLDGIVTVGATVPQVVMLVIGGAASLYRLAAGTAAEASPGIIRPDDYASSTNEINWTQIL